MAFRSPLSKWVVSVLLLAVGSFVARPASANDAEMGGSGSDLVPLENTVVQMVSEDIVLDGTSGEAGVGWVVTAKYVFRNPSEKALDLTMGFPEQVCLHDYECDEDQRFRQMKTEVRGAPVRHRRGRVDESHEWHDAFGTVWLYDVHFEPRESVRVEHSYQLSPGGSVAGDAWVDYVTRTGAMWAGPIKKVRFTILLDYPVLLGSLSNDPPLKSVERLQREGKDVLQMVLQAKNWTPQGDINLTYVFQDQFLPWTHKERLDSAVTFDWKAAAKRSGMEGAHCNIMDRAHVFLPKSAEEFEKMAKDKAAVFAESEADLHICRNALFARHGKIFRNEKLNLYFYGKKNPQGGPRRYFAWQPNPDFETKQLFASDWSTLQALEWAAELRGEKLPASEPPAKPDAPGEERDPQANNSKAEANLEGASKEPPATQSPNSKPAATGGCGACTSSPHLGSPTRWLWLGLFAWTALARRRRNF